MIAVSATAHRDTPSRLRSPMAIRKNGTTAKSKMMLARNPSAHFIPVAAEPPNKCKHSVRSACNEAQTRKNPGPPNYLPPLIELQQPDKKKPQRDVRNYIERLIDAARQSVRQWSQEDALQNIQSGRCHCKNSDPYEELLPPVMAPEHDAQDGNEKAQQYQGILEQLILNVLPGYRSFVKGNRVRIADDGSRSESSGFCRRENVPGCLPDANRKHARRVAAQRK